MRAFLPLVRGRVRAIEAGIGRCAGRIAAREFQVAVLTRRSHTVLRRSLRSLPRPDGA